MYVRYFQKNVLIYDIFCQFAGSSTVSSPINTRYVRDTKVKPVHKSKKYLRAGKRLRN